MCRGHPTGQSSRLPVACLHLCEGVFGPSSTADPSSVVRNGLLTAHLGSSVFYGACVIPGNKITGVPMAKVGAQGKKGHGPLPVLDHKFVICPSRGLVRLVSSDPSRDTVDLDFAGPSRSQSYEHNV